MNHKSTSRKAWLQCIAIILVVLVLTTVIFALIFKSFTLPEVHVELADTGYLTKYVNGVGSAEKPDPYQLKLSPDSPDDEYMITYVYVKPGDRVDLTSPVVAIQGKSSTTLAQLQAQYNDLKKSYDAAVAEDNRINNDDKAKLDDLQKAVDEAKSILTSLENEYSAVLSGKAPSGVLSEQLEALKDRLESLDDRIADISSKKADAKEKYVAAKQAMEDTVREDYEDILIELRAAEDELEGLEDQYVSLEEEIEGYEQDLKEIEKTVKLLEKTLPIMRDIVGLQSKYPIPPAEGDWNYDEVIDDYNETVDKIEDLKEDLYEAGFEDAEQLNSYVLGKYELQYLSATNASESIIPLKENAEALFADVSARYEEAKDRVDTLRILVDAETVLSDSEALYDAYSAQLSSLETEREDLLKEIADKEEELKNTSDKSADEIVKQIEDQKPILKAAEDKLLAEKQHQNTDRTQRNNKLVNQKSQLDTLAAQINAITGGNGVVEINSPVEGVVESVEVQSDDTVTGETVIITIDTAEHDYFCSVRVTSEDRELIKIGDRCNIIEPETDEISAVISDIQEDGEGYIVLIDVDGNLEKGMNITFGLAEDKKLFDTIIPGEYIREDHNGQYVLVAKLKKSFLGTQYIAHRAPITVIASDGNNIAVEGIRKDDLIVTTADIDLKFDQAIKLVEK